MMKGLLGDKDFQEYVMEDLENNHQTYLYNKYLGFLESQSKTPKMAYVLRLETKKKVVTCESCTSNGEVVPGCNRCGGKGTHHKSYQVYEVSPRKVEIVKIDRDPNTGELRYWTDKSEFYPESVTNERNHYVADYPHGVHFIHFNYQEALNEVNRLNKIRKQRGDI